MRTNKKVKQPTLRTFEGTKAGRIGDAKALRRAVASCLLWEDQFYESGALISERLKQLTLAVHPEDAGAIAVDAREVYKLRHAPLWVARWLASGDQHQRDVCAQLLPLIIQRPDEIAEFMALYWKEGKTPIAACVKRGLAAAFTNFNEYQLAKYDRPGAIRLRDVLFMVHAKPARTDVADKALPPLEKGRYRRGQVFRHTDDVLTRLVGDDGNKLAIPGTWENELSAGKDKKEVWEALLQQQKLGALALLRNLRNMQAVKVDEGLIREALQAMKTEWVLPFRFITAARYAPRLEKELEAAMLRCLADQPRLAGRTALIVDTSPSMWMMQVSARSELDRFEAAAALAILCREVCEDVRIYWFNNKAGEVPARSGFALRDVLASTKGDASCGSLATKLAAKDGYDRIIVLTDGQWHPESVGFGWGREQDAVEVAGKPLTDKAYMLNVASQRNAVGDKQHWHLIEGWSEAVLEFIRAEELVG